MRNLRAVVLASLALAALLSPAANAAYSDKTFRVTNTGNGPLTVTTSAQPISGNTAEYALTGNTCANVSVGGSCELTVRFTPNAGGPRPAAALNFTSNGTNGPNHSIALNGTGAASCAGDKQVFSYTGGDQNITVPAGCTTATIKAWGAAGGTGRLAMCSGAGGFAQRTIGGLSSNTTLVVVVGQGGAPLGPVTYGGGGYATVGNGYYGGSGGGMSGVFVSSKTQANALVIAGGGGGNYYGQGYGGAGGGSSGQYGAKYYNYASGAGGTQTSGAAPLQGGPGSATGYGSGGGGGYWGGLGSYMSGAGGGSGYAPGGTLITGAGTTVANSGDADYAQGVGNGFCSAATPGQNGRVVIQWQ